MGDIFKLALRLFVFALVAAVLLAMTNEVTKGPIEKQRIASQLAALNTVLPGCEYNEVKEPEGLAEGSVISQMFTATDEAGELKGYALVANPQGYGGPIPITLGVSTEGYVTQVYVGALQETAGLGTRVGDAEFKDQFIAIAADPDTLRDDVDTIGGATISSTAFVNAVSEMLAYTKGTLGIEPKAGDKEAILAAAAAASGDAEPVVTTGTYDVTGFGPMKVEIAVDDAGKIVSVKVTEHNETPGFGADLIADTAVFDALVGQDIATAQIDVKAGATLTSNAINDALGQAAGGGAAGAATYDVTGFAPFKVEIAVDDAGKIASVKVTEHNETPGFGADLIADTAVFDALVGQDIATAQIDVKAGVTLTSNAINDALAQAAAAFGGDTAPVIPGDPYTVKGFAKFTMYIEVADGKISSISVAAHNETPGLGADMLTDEALSALVGQDLATAQVDVKSGVTLTSNAINEALRQAAQANGIALPVQEPVDSTPADAPAEIPAEQTSAKVYDVQGFQPMKVEIAVDDAGKIVSVKVVEHSETPGLGAALIDDAAVFDALVGQDIATAQIDVKSGVTMTSNAINSALKAAAADVPAAEVKPVETAAEVEGKIYDAQGFQPMKVKIAVDDAGKIVSVKVVEHNETPGLGAELIDDAAVFDALEGQNIATAQIDVKSCVTMTSNAINSALKAAAADASAAAEAPAEEAAAETPTAETGAKVYDVQGFQPMKVEIAVDDAGKIVSVKVTEHNETPGLGAALIDDAAVFDALVGQDIATAQIDVKSGVTMTSNGINSALKAAAADAPAAAEAPAEEAAAETPAAETGAKVYDVQGFQPMKVEIAVDDAGKIVSVKVVEHNETPGLGAALIDDAAVFDALVGQDIATAQIDVKSGVTMTSNGINSALKAAAADAPVAVTATPAPSGNATIYEVIVKGISKHPFTLDVTVDESGTIVAATCPSHTETEGKGATVLTDEALSVLVGQKITDAEFDIKSGVTVTSTAINNALAIIAAHVD